MPIIVFITCELGLAGVASFPRCSNGEWAKRRASSRRGGWGCTADPGTVNRAWMVGIGAPAMEGSIPNCENRIQRAEGTLLLASRCMGCLHFLK